MAIAVGRAQVLGFRVRSQQLDRDHLDLQQAAILSIGVQDTGPDGGLWALALRGVDVSSLPGKELATVWTLRGAPHLYRRRDLPSIAGTVEPYSDTDAGKRIFDAAKPLAEAGIGNLAALDAVATAMRTIVTKPMVKGEVSTRLTGVMDPPYLRFCRPCNATHVYEMPFRLAALRAGLELQPGTSPPVLQRIPGFRRAAMPAEELDVIRSYLHLIGPATVKHVAEYLDAPARDVKARWPSDAVQVRVDGEPRWALADDLVDLDRGPAKVTRLLGPFDLYLQARDRRMLVADPTRAKALWPVLGRPGAVLIDGEIAGLWRPRKSGARFSVRVQPWTKFSVKARKGIAGEAERLAAFRAVGLTGVECVD